MHILAADNTTDPRVEQCKTKVNIIKGWIARYYADLGQTSKGSAMRNLYNKYCHFFLSVICIYTTSTESKRDIKLF